MPFNISDFKTNVVSPELMRSTSYEVLISPPVGSGEPLKLRSESVSLPGAGFMSVDNYKPYGLGKMYTIPYAGNLQEINMTFMVDSKSQVIQTFYDWANLIVDFGQRRSFAAYYYDTYARPIDISLYDLKGNLSKTYKISQAFPISVDQAQMSWASTDEIMKLSVSFKYSEYTIV
jgi:hypothetical protein